MQFLQAPQAGEVPGDLRPLPTIDTSLATAAAAALAALAAAALAHPAVALAAASLGAARLHGHVE